MIEQGSIIADRAPIFALFGANAVSQVGNMMIMVAVPWFVLETTGSAARVGPGFVRELRRRGLHGRSHQAWGAGIMLR